MSNLPKNDTVALLYISRGLLSSLTEPTIVLETISRYLSNINNHIIISTCAVIDGSYLYFKFILKIYLCV